MFIPPPPKQTPEVDHSETNVGVDVYDYISDSLANGSTPAEIQKHLIAFGFSAAEATALMQQFANEQANDSSRSNPRGDNSRKQPKKKGKGKNKNNTASERARQAQTRRLEKELLLEIGRKNMLYGGLWCGGGLIITMISITAASAGGGFVITTGAIVWGAIQFFRGAGQCAEAQKL